MPPSFLRSVGLTALLALAACGSSPDKAVPRDLSAARSTVQKAGTLPMPAAFRNDLSRARAVFVVSPSSGGVALARQPGSGQVSGPAFYDLTRLNPATGGGGTGFSRLPQDREVIAAFMSAKSMDWLASPVLPGQSGLRTAAAAADDAARANADVVFFDLNSPQAPNLEFDLTVIKVDETANQAWYGKTISPAEIFARAAPAMSEAQALQQSIAGLAQGQKR